jgi:DinB family protein
MADSTMGVQNPAMDLTERQKLMQQYQNGHTAVVTSLAGITEAELDERPAADAWTSREIVHHLADSETNSYVRLRKLLAEDNATLMAYDEAEWARRLHYGRSIEPSLAVLKAVRDASAQLLDALSPADWQRSGTHPEHGVYSVDTWLELYAAHAHDHAQQIKRARKGVA